MKKIKCVALLLVFALCFGMAGCGEQNGDAANGKYSAAASTDPTSGNGQAEDREAVILYTNDVHNAYQRNDEEGRIGYAALAAYRDALEAEGRIVTLIDGGDAIQGEALGTLSKGAYLVDIMNETGYSLAVPGNHEFDFGMDTFLDLAENEAEYEYIACNFIDLRTGDPVFDAYKIVDYGGVRIGYVGICTPETFTKSTPTYFQDEDGSYIYSFAEGNDGQDLYDCVQTAIDDAKKNGADYVICVGHLGTDPGSTPWTSYEVISNTTGMIAFLDAHSHSVIEGETVEDKDGNEVVLCSTGTKMTAIGELRVNLNTGEVSASLVTGLTEDDGDLLSFTDSIAAQFEDLLNEVVATADVELTINDPETGERIIRTRETNLGDMCADAYRIITGADVAFVNGGGIRVSIEAGDVTYGDIIAVHPFGNMACVVEATGQQILDCLEMAYRDTPDAECGGFQQVSGLTCVVDTSIPSGVQLDDKGMFLGVEGKRRVSEVKIGGTSIDPEKTYTVASHNYMLKTGGDGLNMFMEDLLLQDEVMIDNQVLISYIQETLGGVISADLYGDPYGEGRIVIK